MNNEEHTRLYDDLVELVARAIAETAALECYGGYHLEDWRQWVKEARAAIKAMDAWSAMIVAREKDKANVG